MNDICPSLEYYANASKCWLVTKPEKEENAKNVFAGTAINISTQGQKHLGAVLGSRSHLKVYVSEKVEDWVEKVVRLAEFAVTQPQVYYTAYTLGLKRPLTYYSRTLPDIEALLEPLECAINHTLIPATTGHECAPKERDLLALPVRLGGLVLKNPCREAS